MKKYYLLFVLNLPLTGEVIRKYILHHSLVFFGADIIAIITFLSLLGGSHLKPSRVPLPFYLMSTVFILLSFILHFVNSNHIGIFGIGLRATFMPIVYLLLSSAFFSRYNNAAALLFTTASVWILAAGSMAILQLYLGEGHPINTVWGEVIGMGDYSGEDGMILTGLFRPTSIFTHTGKFGQVAFMLILFKWSYILTSASKISRISYFLIVFDLITIFASGQRGAFIFLLVSTFILFFIASSQGKKGLGKIAAAVCITSLLLLAATMMLPQYGGAVISRFESALVSIPIRLQGNLILPMQSILQNHLFMGKGLGYFTFGSKLFGGSLVTLGLDLKGLGESSLIRLSGEVGFFGSLILIIAYLSLVLRANIVRKIYNATPIGAVSIFYMLWIGSLMAWANTADVFANSVSTFLGYAYSGAILLPLIRPDNKTKRQ